MCPFGGLEHVPEEHVDMFCVKRQALFYAPPKFIDVVHSAFLLQSKALMEDLPLLAAVTFWGGFTLDVGPLP